MFTFFECSISLLLQYDHEGVGEITLDDFQALLADAQFRQQVAPHKLEVLESLACGNGRATVTYQDIINIVS